MNGLMQNWQLTIDKILEHANRLYPTKRVTTMQPDGSLHRYTYADLYQRVKRLAKALTQLGVEPGDRIGTFAWNNYQHLELYYAIPGAAAVCHTLNIRLFPEQLAYIVNHADDKIVFIDGTLLPLYEKVAPQATGVQYHVLFNAPREAASRLPNVRFYEDLIEGADEDFAWRSTDENMAMGLCYTSGTTGDPKGALYSHRSMFLHTLGESLPNALGVAEKDRVLVVVPQFHAMAWGLPFAAPAAGAELIMPGPHLRPEPLADLIATERVTIAVGVPTIWNGLYYELKQTPRDISCVRALVVGGSAMPRSLTEAYESQLGVNVVHAWGMTELSPLGTVSRLMAKHDALSTQAQWDVKAKQGYPILGVELRIVDEVGAALPWDGKTMGELQVRGPWRSSASIFAALLRPTT
jgi:acyl-CoA synthetase (AMP-forming)/AMP-acid ligase II